MIYNNLKFAGEPVGETRQNVANTRWEDIDATYNKHIIAASQNAEAKACSATGARPGSQDTHDIAGAIAYQGLCLLDEVRVDQLAFGPIGERERSTGFWLDQLDSHGTVRVEV